MGQSRALGGAFADDMSKYITYSYADPVVSNYMCCTGSEPRLLTGIRGVPFTAGTDLSAVTMTFYMAPAASGSSVALSSGTQLSSSTYNMKGTVNVVQTLPLKYQGSAPPPNGIVIPPYTAIGFVVTGTTTAAVGMVQVILEPAS